MGKQKAPQPTDPNVTAAAQTSTNVNTAVAERYLNNVDQVTPYGNLTYSQTGLQQVTDPTNGKTYDVPTFKATTSLSPEGRDLYNLTSATEKNLATLGRDQSGRLNELLASPVDMAGLPTQATLDGVRDLNPITLGSGPQLQGQIGDAGAVRRTYGDEFSQDRRRVEDAMFQRMQPQQDRDRDRLEQRLASQGIRVGSAAYGAAMDDYGRSINDARLATVAAGGAEQSRLAGLEASRAQFENQAQAQIFGQNSDQASFGNTAAQQMFANQQAQAGFNNTAQGQAVNADLARMQAQQGLRNASLQEQFAVRNAPINEISALMSGSQVTQPTFVNAPQSSVPTTDYAGIVANADAQRMQAWQQNQQSRNSLYGGVLGAGASILGGFAAGGKLSDKREKRDIKRVGKADDGTPIYTYRYKSGGPIQMGVMAQEVERKKPEAVGTVGGRKFVDYGIAFGR